MDSLLTAAAASAVFAATGTIAIAFQSLKLTTLRTAWRWAMGAAWVWLIALGWSSVCPGDDPIAEFLWSVVPLMSVCPPIAVLGARRPGVAAWTWFVLLPLIAVLGWPILTVLGSDARFLRIQLETPQLIGFVLVLLMGAGNYIGTKFWAATCLYVVAICLLVAPLSTVTPHGVSAAPARQLASLALGGGVLMAIVQSRRRRSPRTVLDQLWDDYRNTYGIVWGNRLQERINNIARQQSWPLEVTPLGIVWRQPLAERELQEAEVKLEQTLRWLLRRFVDPPWIDVRLNRVSSPED